MPFRKISQDVKLAAIRLHELGLLDLETILGVVGFSRSTFFRIKKIWEDTGEVVVNRVKLGRLRLLHKDDIDYLIRLVRHRPDWFLDELLDLLRTNRFISVHYTTIHRELRRVGMSLKKLKDIARERNEAARADFIARMAQYEPDEIGFIDETSKNEKTLSRRRGRARKGTRAEIRNVFVRGVRLTAVGLLTVDGMATSFVVQGSLTRELFLQFLEFNVVCFSMIGMVFFTHSLQDPSLRSEQHSCSRNG
jgi:transposase